MKRASFRQSGVSLIEALVALAVMGFGMLAVIGLQSTLRYNGDVAKQRAEAVRLAQERIENRRAYSVYGVTPGRDAYAEIITRGVVNIAGANATFALTETAAQLDGDTGRVLIVDVGWTDRIGTVQSVRLGTTILKTLPEVGASLGTPAFGSPSPTLPPGGRHSDIPRTAVDQGDGTSLFTPPGASTVGWVFSNTYGTITSICVDSICTDANARLLAGFVGFSTNAVQPTGVEAELPLSSAFPVEVTVAQTFPTAGVVNCFEEFFPQVIAYYCLIEVNTLAGDKWSGTSILDVSPLAVSTADPLGDRFRVCRYTPVRDSHPVAPADISNAEHPLVYADVTTSLTQQNFLVIRAGDGFSPFTCPEDNTATPFINGNTWHHQPSS